MIETQDPLLQSMAVASDNAMATSHCTIPNVDPDIRLLTLQLLVESVRRHYHQQPQLQPDVSLLVHASDTESVARSGVDIHQLWTNLTEYCAGVEECVFIYYGDSLHLYQKKTTQLAYNLKCNGAYLYATYSPTQLVAIDDTMLARGTMVEKKQHEYALKVDECRKSLDTNGLFKEFETGVAMETCPKCRGSQLSYSAVQDRSADEGQTVHFHCLNSNCRHKWRVRT